MNEQQALLIIKSVLDLATQRGCFDNLQAAATAANAFNVIATKHVPDINQVMPQQTPAPAQNETTD